MTGVGKHGLVKCHGGVSIPCRPVTPSVSNITKLGKLSNPMSKSVCQKWPNDGYETR
jgi:hypothetical protein